MNSVDEVMVTVALAADGSMRIVVAEREPMYTVFRESDTGVYTNRLESPVELTPEPALKDRKRSQSETSWDFLYALLVEGPLPVTEVFEAMRYRGYSDGATRDAKRRLGVQSRKNGFSGNWQWSLPETLKTPKKGKQ